MGQIYHLIDHRERILQYRMAVVFDIDWEGFENGSRYYLLVLNVECTSCVCILVGSTKEHEDTNGVQSDTQNENKWVD